MKEGDIIRRKDPKSSVWAAACARYGIDPTQSFELEMSGDSVYVYRFKGYLQLGHWSVCYLEENFELVETVGQFDKIPALLEKAKSLVGKLAARSAYSPAITVKNFGVSFKGNNTHLSESCVKHREKHGFVVFVHNGSVSFPVDDAVERFNPIVVSGAEVTKTHVTLKSGEILSIKFLRKIIKASETFN